MEIILRFARDGSDESSTDLVSLFKVSYLTNDGTYWEDHFARHPVAAARMYRVALVGTGTTVNKVGVGATLALLPRRPGRQGVEHCVTVTCEARCNLCS